jgi:hypothetical protein
MARQLKLPVMARLLTTKALFIKTSDFVVKKFVAFVIGSNR